jgi:type IV pilus assembly protein PilE
MKAQGFSLIELVVTLTLIGLLLSFAYPSYLEALLRARRVDGQTALVELANRLEHYYAQSQSYQGATLGTNSTSDLQSSKYSAQNWYLLVITSQTDQAFYLEAIPPGAQVKDFLCQTLSFNSFGIKGIKAGPAGKPKGRIEQCW